MRTWREQVLDWIALLMVIIMYYHLYLAAVTKGAIS